jgi:hypothetical protein
MESPQSIVISGIFTYSISAEIPILGNIILFSREDFTKNQVSDRLPD